MTSMTRRGFFGLVMGAAVAAQAKPAETVTINAIDPVSFRAFLKRGGAADVAKELPRYRLYYGGTYGGVIVDEPPAASAAESRAWWDRN